jgi:hypothetical protein
VGCSPDFRERLRREIALRLQEMKDGCVDCEVRGDFCDAHAREAHELITNPRKYIKLSSTKKPRAADD